MTFQPGDIVVCVDDSRRSSLHESPSFETGDVLTVAAIGDYWVRLEGHPSSWCRDRFRLATDEEKQQFLKGKTMKEQKIEGIPDGWELVRIGKPEPGEWVVSNPGDPIQWLNDCTMANYAIIRKIEKPKRFRAFASKSEFAPHRDRWIVLKGCEHDSSYSSWRVGGYQDNGVYIDGDDGLIGWDELFGVYVFEHGNGVFEPCGVEVVE
jgi:hypothetical protein